MLNLRLIIPIPKLSFHSVQLHSLRAYPLRQLARLCCVLHEQHLPLGRPAVHTLIRQCLFQLGTIAPNSTTTTTTTTTTSSSSSSSSSSSNGMYLVHRTGWDEEGGVLHTLGAEIMRLAAELQDTPRDHDAVLLLGEMAAYLADWSSVCADAAMRFAIMTSHAADALVRLALIDSGRTIVLFCTRHLEKQDLLQSYRLLVGHWPFLAQVTCLNHLHMLTLLHVGLMIKVSLPCGGIETNSCFPGISPLPQQEAHIELAKDAGRDEEQQERQVCSKFL